MHCRLVRLRQAPESAEILLKATQLEGGCLVAGSVCVGALHLLLPEPGASDQEQVTQKELHCLKGERHTQGKVVDGGWKSTKTWLPTSHLGWGEKGSLSLSLCTPSSELERACFCHLLAGPSAAWVLPQGCTEGALHIFTCTCNATTMHHRHSHSVFHIAIS